MTRTSEAVIVWIIVAAVFCGQIKPGAADDATTQTDSKKTQPKKKGAKKGAKESPADVKRAEEYLEKWRQREVLLVKSALAKVDQEAKPGKRKAATLQKRLTYLEKHKNPKLGPLELAIGHIGYVNDEVVVEQVIDPNTAAVYLAASAKPGSETIYVIVRGDFGAISKGTSIQLHGVMCVTGTEMFQQSKTVGQKFTGSQIAGQQWAGGTRKSENKTTLVLEPFDDRQYQRALKELEKPFEPPK